MLKTVKYENASNYHFIIIIGYNYYLRLNCGVKQEISTWRDIKRRIGLP